MLDIELFRNNLEQIIESEKKRFKDPSNAEKVLEFDKKWRDVLSEIQDLRNKRNQISRQIGDLHKKGEKEKAEDLKSQVKNIKGKIEELERDEKDFLEEREKYRYIVGNILHESVPIAETEEGNEIIRIPFLDWKYRFMLR